MAPTPGSGTLNYCVFRYGGALNTGYTYTTILIAGTNASVTMSDTVVQYNANNGVTVQSVTNTPAITRCSFSDNTAWGVWSLGSSNLQVTGSTFQRNGSGGAYLDGSTGQISTSNFLSQPLGVNCVNSANPVIGGSPALANTFHGNTSYGVQNTSSAVTVNATHNSWGNASGPYHPTLNSSGTGDPVSDYVSFEPWLDEALDLTIYKGGPGTGTVTGTNGLNCTTYPCSKTYDAVGSVTISAVGDPGWVFVGWSGGTGSASSCSGTDPCTFTLSTDSAVTATFVALPTVTTAAVSQIHSTSATGGGNISSDGGAAIWNGGVCWSTAPNPTTSDNCTSDVYDLGAFTSSITGLTPNTPYHVRAYATNSAGTAYGADVGFTTLIAYRLTTQVSPDGNGTIGLNPSGGSYDAGSSVQLTAGPAWGYRFDHWELDLSGSANPTSIIMDANKSVRAVFVALPQYTLTVAKTGDGNGTVTSLPPGIDCGATCSNSYYEGSVVTLRAIPDSGSYFAGWSGGCTSQALTCMVTLDAAKTVTATFTDDQPSIATWAKTYTVTGDDWLHAIQQTADGGYIVAGNMRLSRRRL